MSDKTTTCWIISAVTETCHYGKLMRYYVLDENGSVVCETKTHKEAQKIVEAVNFKELYDDRAKYPKDVSEEILRMKERIEKLEKKVNKEPVGVYGIPQESYSRWVGMGGSQGYTLAPESMKKEESFAYKKGETVFFVGVSTFEVYEGTVEKDVPHYSRGILIRPVEIEKFGGLPHEVSSFLVFRTYNEAYQFAKSKN